MAGVLAGKSTMSMQMRNNKGKGEHLEPEKLSRRERLKSTCPHARALNGTGVEKSRFLKGDRSFSGGVRDGEKGVRRIPNITSGDYTHVRNLTIPDRERELPVLTCKPNQHSVGGGVAS